MRSHFYSQGHMCVVIEVAHAVEMRVMVNGVG